MRVSSIAPLILPCVLALGCGHGARSSGEWALPPGLDPLVEERIEQALAGWEDEQPGALLELAKTYEANGLAELAVKAYRACLERGGAELGGAPAQLHYRLATSLELGGRNDEALQAYEETRRLAPDYAPAHWRAGNLWIDLGRSQEARDAFVRALQLEPTGIPATLGLARVQLLEGQAAAALATLEPLASQRPRERFVHGLLARARRAQGDEAGAGAALKAEERAVEMHWADPWTAETQKRATGVSFALKKANELLLDGNARGALAVLEPVLTRCPDELALVQLVIKARIEAGELARAGELIEKARKHNAEPFKLGFYAGLVALRKKELPRAKQELEAVLTLNPAFGPALGALGEVELRLGSLEPAEAAFERALEQGESDLRTRTLFAQVEIQLGKLERACVLLEAARLDFPLNVVPLAHLAEAQVRRGEAATARVTLAEAERIDPSFAYLAKVRELLDAAEVR